MIPRELVRELPLDWWLRKPSYFLFMVRELTSVFVAGYAVLLIVMVWRAESEAAFSGFYEALQSPWVVALQLVALAAVIFHTVTWINLLPKVIVVWRGEQRIPGRVIAGTNYIAWIVISVVVAGLALR